MRYIPNDEERDSFERYLEREGIEDDKDIQKEWKDFREELIETIRQNANGEY